MHGVCTCYYLFIYLAHLVTVTVSSYAMLARGVMRFVFLLHLMLLNASGRLLPCRHPAVGAASAFFATQFCRRPLCHRPLLSSPPKFRTMTMSSAASDGELKAALPPSSSSPQREEGMLFGRFQISPEQIFYRSPSNMSAAIVNLRPIVAGHVLVVSARVAPLLSDLSDEEHADLWATVRTVQTMLRDCHGTCAFNVAVQDGRLAGQSVPHAHVHILPRVEGDFDRNDDVYDEIEAWAPRTEVSEAKKGAENKLAVPEDQYRRDRTMEQMAEEARQYREALFHINDGNKN